MTIFSKSGFYKICWQIIVLLLIFQFSLAAQTLKSDRAFLISEDAYRANNRGVSLLEQFKPDDAEKEFRRALTLKNDFKLATINLAIALFNSKELDEAKQTAREYLQTKKDSLKAIRCSDKLL